MTHDKEQGRNLFRENAIKRLNSLEAIECSFRVIQPAAWLWILIAVTFFISLSVWGIWGKVSTNVIAIGIILPNSQFMQTEKLIKEGIQQRKSKLEDLKILLEKKRKLFNKKYLNVTDMEKAEDDYIAATEDLINFSNKGYANTHLSVFSNEKNEPDANLDALVFVSYLEGKKIQAGMRALLNPGAISIYKYGYIQGTVISVSKYPASKDAVYAYLGNMNLVDEFFTGGAPFMVKIKLEKY